MQAAITVLGRGPFPHPYPNPEMARLDLADTDLRRGYLRDADLRVAPGQGRPPAGMALRADLREANLEEADLRGAYLEHADLPGAVLDNAYANSWTRWP